LICGTTSFFSSDFLFGFIALPFFDLLRIPLLDDDDDDEENDDEDDNDFFDELLPADLTETTFSLVDLKEFCFFSCDPFSETAISSE
jgi:hypothetical protein